MLFGNEVGRLTAIFALLINSTSAFVPAGKKVGWKNAPLETVSLIHNERKFSSLISSMVLGMSENSPSTVNGDSSRRPMGPPPRRPGSRNNQRPPRGRGGPGAPGGPNRGGPGGPRRERNFAPARPGMSLVLENPMKLQRVLEERPNSRPDNDRNNDRNNGRNNRSDGGSQPAQKRFSVGSGGDNGPSDGGGGPGAGRGRKQFGKKDENKTQYEKNAAVLN